MTIRCAWCGEFLGALLSPLSVHEVTDGICPACFDKQVEIFEASHPNEAEHAAAVGAGVTGR